MHQINAQQGIGLAEVLVAVLLLSIAVLGFSALQVRAISATDESLVRTKALTLTRNLSEIMRAYPEAYVIGSNSSFTSAIPTASGANPTIQSVVKGTATTRVNIDNKSIGISGNDDICLSNEVINKSGKKIAKQSCNMNQLAARDALIIKNLAQAEDIKIAVEICPGTTLQAIQKQMCIITAWNDTEAMLSDSNDKACADSQGVYRFRSHCLISEAY